MSDDVFITEDLLLQSEEARRLYQESLDHLVTTADRQGLAAAHASLGLAHRDSGEPGAALESYGEAIRQARVLGNRSWLAELLSLSGDARLETGDVDGAEREFIEAVDTGAGIDDDQARAAVKRALLGLAWWAWRSVWERPGRAEHTP